MDGDVRWQESIEGRSEPPGLDGALSPKVRYLGDGVDSRVCAASYRQGGKDAEYLLESGLEGALNRAQVALTLPAVKLSAVVFDEESYVPFFGGHFRPVADYLKEVDRDPHTKVSRGHVQPVGVPEPIHGDLIDLHKEVTPHQLIIARGQ